MRKTIKFIKRTFLFIILILLILFIGTTYIYSKKHNTSFSNTILNLEIIGNEFLSTSLTQKNTIDISINNINTESNNNNSIETSAPITNENYYYNQLDNYSKIIYNELEANIDNLKKQNYTIEFSNKFENLLKEASGEYKLNKAFQSALDAFFYDHPELFYIDITKLTLNTTCTTIGPIEKYSTKLYPRDNKNYLLDYFNSENNVEDAINKVEKVKNNFVREFKNCDDYTKILQVHNALAKTLEYDSSLKKDNIHNIYGALINKEVVCEGYAKALKYLLNALDIECILVCGTAKNSSGHTESHMWNYVKLNNNWYGVDVTWDDPIIIGGSGKTNNVRQEYFLRGHRTFVRTHFPSGKLSDTGITFKLPTLSDNNYR